MEPWSLNEEEYKILLSYIGCGEIPKADILIFGNEEGTGGYSVTANVKARTQLFGRDEISGSIKHCIEENNWREGFYQPDAQTGGKLVEQFLLPHEKKHLNDFTGGVFNAAIARLCLSSERSGEDNWFQGSANTTAFNTIKEYIRQNLYKPRTEGIQTALLDWRPLPRLTESRWYTIEYGAVALSPENKPNQENPYLAVFNKPKAKYNPKRYSTSGFSDFKEDMEFRTRIIKNALIKSDAQILLSIGGAGGFKKDALELMFGSNIFTPVPFSCDMRNSKGQLQKAFQANVPLQNKHLHIFLIPFPSAGQGFVSQQNALSMLEELSIKMNKILLTK